MLKSHELAIPIPKTKKPCYDWQEDSKRYVLTDLTTDMAPDYAHIKGELIIIKTDLFGQMSYTDLRDDYSRLVDYSFFSKLSKIPKILF